MRTSGAQRAIHRRRRAGRVVLAGLLAVLATALGGLPIASAEPTANSSKPAAGKPGGSAVEVINAAIERALKILRDEQLKKDGKARMAKLRAAVDGVFDWEAMARSSIGHNWRNLDDQQRTEFVSVFKELLAKQYMDDIDRFQGSEELRVKGGEQRGEQTIVKTLLITVSREEVPIDYTMHKPGADWLVEDVAIEGVSMVNHYRKSFGRFLVNEDFSVLLTKLKRKLGTQ